MCVKMRHRYVFCFIGLFQKVKNLKNEVGGIMCQCNFSNVTSIGPQVPSRFALSKSVNLKNWQSSKQQQQNKIKTNVRNIIGKKYEYVSKKKKVRESHTTRYIIFFYLS